jgi:hypothetical protein
MKNLIKEQRSIENTHEAQEMVMEYEELFYYLCELYFPG